MSSLLELLWATHQPKQQMHDIARHQQPLDKICCLIQEAHRWMEGQGVSKRAVGGGGGGLADTGMCRADKNCCQADRGPYGDPRQDAEGYSAKKKHSMSS